MNHTRTSTLLLSALTIALVSACGSHTLAPSQLAAAAGMPTSPQALAANVIAQTQKAVENGDGGEVRGAPAAGSKFIPLRMGMSMKEVTALIGAPTDKHSYITGKGFLWSSGSDTYRQEFLYKGAGRLTFASNGGFSTESHLIRIVHDAEEKGTRS